jgi:hypothetical protein
MHYERAGRVWTRGWEGSPRKVSESMTFYLEGKTPLDANDLSRKRRGGTFPLLHLRVLRLGLLQDAELIVSNPTRGRSLAIGVEKLLEAGIGAEGGEGGRGIDGGEIAKPKPQRLPHRRQSVVFVAVSGVGAGQPKKLIT